MTREVSNIEAALLVIQTLGPKPMLLKHEHQVYDAACATLARLMEIRTRYATNIAEPTDAPAVAQLMEELNDALGRDRMAADPRTPKSIWEDMLADVRRNSRATSPSGSL